MLVENLKFIKKYLDLLFQLYFNSICKLIIASECFCKKINFINYPVFLNFITYMLDESLEFYRKMAPIPF